MNQTDMFGWTEEKKIKIKYEVMQKTAAELKNAFSARVLEPKPRPDGQMVYVGDSAEAVEAAKKDGRRPRRRRKARSVKTDDIRLFIFENARPMDRDGLTPEQHAERCYEARLAYNRGDHLSELTCRLVSEWMCVNRHLEGKTRNPYAEYYCRWCGDKLPPKRFGVGAAQYDERETCSVDSSGRGARKKNLSNGCVSKCATDLHTSRHTHAKGDIGSVGFIGMWIESNLQCYWCDKYYPIGFQCEGDHKTPGTIADGIRVICRGCNGMKGRMNEEQMRLNPPFGILRYHRNKSKARIEEIRLSAIEDTLHWCLCKRIKQRCEAIVEGRKDVEIHPYDADYAEPVLQWIKDHEYLITE